MGDVMVRVLGEMLQDPVWQPVAETAAAVFPVDGERRAVEQSSRAKTASVASVSPIDWLCSFQGFDEALNANGDLTHVCGEGEKRTAAAHELGIVHGR